MARKKPEDTEVVLGVLRLSRSRARKRISLEDSAGG
jgi:hypothetical protein